jgi:hypothetical protein
LPGTSESLPDRRAGTVIREERGKLTIYWADLDFWSRHQPESLDLAGAPAGLNDNAAQPKGETT